jgi:hypothetical protein
MKRLMFGAALAGALTIGATASGAAVSDTEDKKVTVKGCVLKGDEGGFLLADLMMAAAPTSVPQPRVLYVLKDDDDLEGHTGHRVEITGELEGELEKGQIEIEREDKFVKLEIKTDGRDLKLRLPEEPAAIGTAGDKNKEGDEKEIDYVVRKLDVESVKMIAATCR